MQGALRGGYQGGRSHGPAVLSQGVVPSPVKGTVIHESSPCTADEEPGERGLGGGRGGGHEKGVFAWRTECGPTFVG